MAAPALIVPAATTHTATVIMAHGLGDSGAGWVGLAENWRRRGKFDEVKFIFPNAPSIPITINLGTSMPGWYDITSFNDLKDSHDEPGILRSRAHFNDLLQTETSAGIPSTRIVLGGFSQGGAISLFTGATTPHRLAGIFGLSAYLLLADRIRALADEGGNNANRDTRWFMGHGDRDPLVKYEWGVQTAEVLRTELGVSRLDFQTYHGLAHSADPLEIDHLEAFIAQCLPPVQEGKGKDEL